MGSSYISCSGLGVGMGKLINSKIKGKKIIINSSLIKTSPILKVLRLYKIVITLESFPNGFRRWVSVRPTICDQAQVDRTLRSGVRAQNEGKFELFVVTSTLT